MPEVKPPFRVVINKFGNPEVVDTVTAGRDVAGMKMLQEDGTWSKGDVVGGTKRAKPFTKQEALEFVKKNKGSFIRRH